MTSAIAYENPDHRMQSSDMLISKNYHIRQWLVIVGLVTIGLLLSVIFINCILRIRRVYRRIELDEEKGSSACTQYENV
ncbi:unnamed protein product [Adineta ricciae]|uniref:Uncharacterized protein n=1 Tax=Adineta ricciae TaxID=249248 RepID=A0A816B0U8_ADIRI|nr:unnamed protein product [Adineta ricciae]CAF1604194.1 unnamed protein product [Adineta ricciae]